MWFGIYKAAKYAVYPLSWIAIVGLLALIAACLPVTPRRTTWVRRFTFFTLLVVFLTATPLLSTMYIAWLEGWYPPFQTTSPLKADAIVVLAGGVFAKGSLRPSDDVSDASRQRTTCGADLWRQGLAPQLVLTGGDATVLQTGPIESHEMKRWAQRLGVPESAILVEEKSRTTYENALQTKAILGAGHILLVTAAYHLPRAVGLFEKQGFVVTPVACGYESKHTPSQIWTQSAFFDFLPTVKALLVTTQVVDEVVGMMVYRVAGKL
ncbi:MAG: YdcF family protein [Nitrospirota bacterium]|nr:YdcF family protein [Nitrospirota bacterium]